MSILGILGGTLVGGCRSVAEFCGPPPLHVSPNPVVMGGTITLSAGQSECELDQVRPYTVRLNSEAGIDYPLGQVQASRASGSFSVDFILPQDASPGSYVVFVDGSSLDQESDEESESRAAYATTLVIRPQ